MKTIVNATEQLEQVINATDENTINTKLTSYYLDHLEDFRCLVLRIGRFVAKDYKFSILYNNNKNFWNTMFSCPSEVLKSITPDFKATAKYVYQSTNGLFYSCNNISDFYKDQDIKNLICDISHRLKKDPTDTLDAVFYETHKLLLEILEN